MPTNGDFIQRHAEAVSKFHKVSVIHIVSDKSLNSKTEISKSVINGVSTQIAYVKSKNKIKKPFTFFKTFNNLIDSVEPYDVIHLNEIYPFGLFLLFTNKPYIISEHWTGYYNNKINWFRLLLSKQIVKKASFVSPVSNHLKKSMIKIGLKGNYKTVPNVVDTSIFSPSEKKNGNFNIVHISAMNNHHKNIFGMLEVAKQLENKIGYFSWKFIGGKTSEINQKINSLNFKKADIEFIKHIPQNEMVNYLKDASVFVLFSNYENLPCVILESFSCGVPVISTNVGGISEFFPKSFGKLISKNNKEELLNNLIKYYKNSTVDKEKMHAYAVDNFSKKVIASKFSELYFKAIKHS